MQFKGLASTRHAWRVEVRPFFVLKIFQAGDVDWWQIITVIVVPTASAIWVWYTTKYVPARLAREAEEARARQGAEAVTREHQQKQEDLQVAYHISEAAAAQQIMAELVATSQEEVQEANRFIRQDIKNDLETIANKLANLVMAVSKLIETEEHRAKLFTLQNGILSEISQDLRNQQAKISLLVELENDGRRQNQTE